VRLGKRRRIHSFTYVIVNLSKEHDELKLDVNDDRDLTVAARYIDA
jgi:hypothetical protein